MEKQLEIQRLKELRKEILRANPLYGYKPHPKQALFHESKKPIKAFLGGNRSGKTTAGILDDIIQAVDSDVLPDHLKPYKKFDPPFHGRVVVPGFDIMEGVVFQKFREWTPKDQFLGGSWETGFEKSRKILRFKNGSFFDFLTFEQDIDKFGGTAKHRLHYDEEPPRQIRQEGRMRLLDYEGADEIFTMTPQLGLDWMFDEIWEAHNHGNLPHALVIQVKMDENPYLSEQQKEILLQGFSREELEARSEGRFVHFHGMIYPEFKKHTHVIPEVTKIPDDARVYRGIDPGVRVQAAVVWVYIDSTGQMVAFDELILTHATVAQVSEAIRRRDLRWGTAEDPLKVTWSVIDPSARNVMHQTGRSDQMEYADNGIYTVLGQNSVSAGINRVKERLQNERLQITANCKILIDQFQRYRWSTPTKSENDPKEAPVKKDDHLLDALRYVVMSRPYAEAVREEPVLYDPLEMAMKEELEGKRPKEIPRTQEGGVFA